MIKISKEAITVFETIKLYGPIRSAEIAKKLGISIQTVYKHLSRLIDEQMIKKIGTTPKVFYGVNIEQDGSFSISDINDQIIEQNYIYVSSSGEMIMGVAGFREWCLKNSFDLKKEKEKFSEKISMSEKMKKNGLISAKKSILLGKKDLDLDEIFFSDFYTLDHFGKTKLGQLVYLGKSSQNKILISEIAKITKPHIKELIGKYDIKSICFIPPTIDRKIQFLDVFKSKLGIDLLEIKTMKVSSATKVPQKTLRKLEDRIINAKDTIAVNPNQTIIGNVLIIDDATGSGATLNETAKKIRRIAKEKIKIVGYSVVGSHKGFDVISEV